MQTLTEELKLLSIRFNLDTHEWEKEVIEIEKDKEEDNLKYYYNIIDCDCIDVVEYSDDIDIIVDDEGLFKSGNPALEITTKFGDKKQLLGKLVFVKRDGENHISLDTGDIFDLMVSLKIRVIGVTK